MKLVCFFFRLDFGWALSGWPGVMLAYLSIGFVLLVLLNLTAGFFVELLLFGLSVLFILLFFLIILFLDGLKPVALDDDVSELRSTLAKFALKSALSVCVWLNLAYPGLSCSPWLESSSSFRSILAKFVPSAELVSLRSKLSVLAWPKNLWICSTFSV